LDPENDRPEVLKDYAAKFDAREGWLFLTGDKDQLRTIGYRLGQVDERIEAHIPHLLIGNVKVARWSKLRPNLPAAAIAMQLRAMAAY
jgi:cytochrome oxidase Cu insertion factor (SCO1/SenC/PrrC family)